MRKGGFHIAEIFVTTAEAAFYEGRSEQTIRRWIREGKYKFKTETVSGITRHLILLDSLSEQARREYLRLQEIEREPEPTVNQPEPKEEVHIDVLGRLKRRYGQRGEKLVEEIVFRENIAKMVISIRASKELGRTARINNLAASVGQSPATIRRWADKYVEFGQEGLLHSKTMESLYTPKSYRSFHPLAQDYLRVLWLDPSQPSIETVYEKVVKKANEKGWKIGSYNTACRIIQDIPEEDAVYFREGRKAWEATYMPRAIREDPDMLNEVFEIDHTQMNFFIEISGKAVRPWLTFVVEVKCRCVVGWCLSLQANAETIGLALRHAILPKPESSIFGLPKYVIIDNGKDFRSKRIAGRNPNFGKEIHAPHLLGLFGKMGVMPRYCRAYNGAGKGRVERSFRTATEQFYRDYVGWCGANPGERPEQFDPKKLLAEHKLVDFDQCLADLKEFIHAFNHMPRDMFEGESSMDIYKENKRWKEEVPSPRQFDVWLLAGEARKVHNTGVRFRNRIYENVKALTGHVREEISILYDPNDPSYVLAHTLDGDFIDVLPLKQYRPYITDEESTFKHVAQQKARATSVRERKKEMEDRLKADGVKKPGKIQRMATGDNAGDPKVIIMHRDEQVAKKAEEHRQKEQKPDKREPSIHEKYREAKFEQLLQRMKLN